MATTCTVGLHSSGLMSLHCLIAYCMTKTRLPICCTLGISQIRRWAGFNIAIDDITSDHDIKLVSRP